MGVAFRRGSTTGPADLTITIRDNLDNLTDPYRVEYAVFDYTTGIEVLQGSPVNTPVRMSLGSYYALVTIPADSNIGSWRIRWTVQEKVVDPVYQSVEEFAVVGDAMIPSFTGDPNIDALIHSLRILLRDNNPDRNYRFRPPESERFIQGQTQVFGFIWEDEELYEYILMAVSDFNGRPPTTAITVNDVTQSGSVNRWKFTVLLKAANIACIARALNWISDEFSLSGDELLRLKDEKNEEHILSIEDLFDIIYGELIDKIVEDTERDVRKAIEELIGEDLKATLSAPKRKSDPLKKGLKESFLKGSLKVRSMVNKSPVPEWRSISNVLRHFTPHKKIVQIHTDMGSVKVTEDHSLFSWQTKEPVSAIDLKKGDLIVGLPGKEFEPSKILEVEILKPLKNTYDVSVPEAENAVLDSGLLVHNTYSISGVSLDLEKSSKYQSMADSLDAQYDKLVEANKTSIKIIKGLRQFRYGIGITSALGPMSRPGVQSRRNMISAGQGGGY